MSDSNETRPQLRLVGEDERAPTPDSLDDDPVTDVEDLPDDVVLPLIADYLFHHGLPEDSGPEPF